MMGFGIGDWGFGKAEGRSGNRIRSGRHPIPNPESPIPASWPPPVEAHERRRVRQLVQALHVQRSGVGRFEELREQLGHAAGRSEERRVGKECVSTCRYGWAPDNEKKTNKKKT